MRTRALSIAALATSLVVVVGCGGGDDGSSDAEAAGSGGGNTIVGTEFEYDPSEFTLPADTATEVTLDNQGAVEHDITIDELDVQIHTAAGETASGSITAAAGTYDFYCSIPGHQEAGMEGTLTVE